MSWRRVAAPMVLLAALLLALAFRWDTEATKSLDTGVIMWERDRFTGHLHKRVYPVSAQSRSRETIEGEGYGFWRIFVMPPRSGKIEDFQRSTVTSVNATWFLLAAGSAVWLIVAARGPGLDRSKSSHPAP